MILTGGTILSMDKFLAPAQALAIVDGRILAVGNDEEIRSLANWQTKRIDLNGAVVVPGLTDSHLHLLGFGRSLEEIQLVGTASPEAVAALVAAKARELPPSTWIRGRGWDQNDWDAKVYPTKDILDRAAPDHPVLLSRIDGHAIWVNSRAMAIAGVTTGTPVPDGGAIIQGEGGNPTGIFIDNAEILITDKLPEAGKEDIRRWLLAAVRRLNQAGLTGVHDAGVGETTIEVLRELIDEGKFTLRYYGMLDGSDEDLLNTYLAGGPVLDYGEHMTLRAVKLYADGALGSRGAALLEPYHDDPDNRGLIVTPVEELERLIERSMRAGFQPCIHAIGDRGNRVALDIYERVMNRTDQRELRPRIEHAQVLSLRDIRRFARLDIIPAMQPSHATSDMYWAEDRLGPDRIRGAYAWRKILNTGVVIPGGSDCPVEREEPLLQLYAARTRQDASGWPEGGWYPQERMGGLEALKTLTSWAAYAAFEEAQRGKILPGYTADLTILDTNPVVCKASEILTTKVLLTIVGGEVVWRDKAGLRAMEKQASN
ncbi:amidohydrolase [Candidatus Neomarinimicrobiota bacterium]